MLLAGHISIAWVAHEPAMFILHARSWAAATCDQTEHTGKMGTQLLAQEVQQAGTW